MTPSEFRAFWKKGSSDPFKDYTDAQIQPALDLAPAWFNQSRFGARYTEGLACYVAHELKWDELAAKNPYGGDALSKTVGRESISKDSRLLNEQAKNFFMTTMYGRRFLMISRQAGIGALVVGTGCGGQTA